MTDEEEKYHQKRGFILMFIFLLIGIGIIVATIRGG